MGTDVSWWRRDAAGDVVIRVTAKPGARRSAVAGVVDGALVVRVAARPIEGAANRELERFLGGLLDVAPGRVRVERGTNARHKSVRVAGPVDPVRLGALA